MGKQDHVDLACNLLRVILHERQKLLLIEAEPAFNRDVDDLNPLSCLAHGLLDEPLGGYKVPGRAAITPILAPRRTASRHISSSMRIKGMPILIIAGLLLICGMFIDSSPAIVLLCPILASAVQAVGINPVQFGVVMVIVLTIGLLTPPVGTALFVASNVTKVPLLRLSLRELPFIGIMFLAALMIAYVPETATRAIKGGQ